MFELNPVFLENTSKLLDDSLDFVKKGKVKEYLNVPCVFDIETSSFYQDRETGETKKVIDKTIDTTFEKEAIMYAWVFGINGKCIRGRTWDEFKEALNEVKEFYHLGHENERYIIIYVHNLAYEFQFIRHLFNWLNVFCMDDRKPLYAITEDGFEFRCSFLLAGLNLAKVGENLLKYKVNKMVGDLDYSLIRHSKTPLTPTEWGYILNDGLVVMAFIQEEIERMGDIAKIPLTKTGYVRLLAREYCFKGKDRQAYNRQIKHLTMTKDDYEQLKRVYAGGFTHANNTKVDKIYKNVASFDFTSSYPTTLISEMYPMSAPKLIEIKSKEDLEKKLNSYSCFFDCVIYNIRSKVEYEHYISASKCWRLEHPVLDNGRVVEAFRLGISLTEVDFKLLKEMYEWDSIEFYNFKIMYRAYLPRPIIQLILDLYQKKTTLKGVQGKEDEYLSAKGMLNSVYGMCVTDPCKHVINYINDEYTVSDDKSELELINDYNISNTRFLFYAWGVWNTAYSRYNLFTGINEFKNDYIYSDTDSIKVLNYEKHMNYINEYNKDITLKLKRCLKYYNLDVSLICPKTIKGKEKPLGVWDFEEVMDEFKTLGAKRYIALYDNDIHLTVAGVAKLDGANYLKWKYNGDFKKIMKNFTDRFVFPATYIDNGVEKLGCGKNVHSYLDYEQKGEVMDYLGNKSEYFEKSSVHLEATSYNLCLSEEFLDYLKGIKKDYIKLGR